MDRELDLADIQGNILQEFVSGYPAARFLLLRVTDARKGRQFVLEYRSKVTTALRWASSKAFAQKIQTTKPDIAINIGFTFSGFLALELPTRTLARLPPEFIDGMRKRAAILGDDKIASDKDGDAVQHWDPVWRTGQAHIIIGLNSGIDGAGNPLPGLDRETEYLEERCAEYGLQILRGHGKNNAAWQDACALLAPDGNVQMEKNKATYKPVPREHFGFIDGISNPVFDGQFGDPHADQMMSIGNGKLLPTVAGRSDLDRWAPLATGEFLLGYPDEAQEVADMAAPNEIMRNGTFMVFRKLHENIKSFKDYFDRAAQVYARANNVPVADACMILKAKMAGRWEDGVPVAVASTIAEWKAFNAKNAGNSGPDWAYTNFTYGDDPHGAKCPVAAHMRRTNTRDSLTGTSSALNNRRRILRRGQPYGKTVEDDDGDHGIIFMVMCASIERQFEFVQQQWINYGLDSNAGSDTCPIVGNRRGDSKFIVPVDPKSQDTPFIAAGIPQFVEMRGGDYFFLPSMTALRMIGMGTIDPT
ncbi:MAG TPA: Dyp-type peroxidase [Rhizomicrobium sp.]|nr:Dyp-type peroxidase [Rhizomicrobium sp.]